MSHTSNSSTAPVVAAHTPGPWHVLEAETKKRNRRVFTVFAADEELKYVAYCDDQLYFVQPTDNRANAHLIAAAPELLMACEWLEDFVNAVNEDRVTQDQRNLYSSMMAVTRAALTKARGL